MEKQSSQVIPLPVSMITVETPDTKTFRLGLGSYKPFPFLPGQFIIISTKLHHPQKNIVTPVNRAFSISSSPLEESYLEITAKKYQDGRMTPWLHDSVKVGDILNVKGPDGKFVFREGETDELILIAGGIGIAPFRSIIRYILTRKLPVRVRLVYSARTPLDFAYKHELDEQIKNHTKFECRYTVTRAHADWSGRVGRVDEVLLREYLGNSKALYYLCGPISMIRESTESLKKMGVPKESIRFERW